MPRDRIPHSVLPPTEGGYLSKMELTFNEADFIMYCIESFTNYDEVPFLDEQRRQVVLTYEQISDLFIRVQELKFANN
jgi:hypothetical protein